MPIDADHAKAWGFGDGEAFPNMVPQLLMVPDGGFWMGLLCLVCGTRLPYPKGDQGNTLAAWFMAEHRACKSKANLALLDEVRALRNVAEAARGELAALPQGGPLPLALQAYDRWKSPALMKVEDE